MPELDWKKSGQDKALEFTGGNMLVSASAGSGKTTVMVEKIKRYIEAGGSLKRLVVVTFTRASAADMKEKIELELKELVRRTGDKRYKDELRALPISYIGTVDSLCQNIYRNYFEDAGGAPVFKVLEEDESAALLREASDEVLEESLAEEDSAFEEFLARYAPVSVADGFFETVAGLFSYLDTRSDPEAFFERARSVAKSDFDLNPAVKYLRERTEAKFRSFLEDADYFVSVAKGAPRARVQGLIDSVAGLAAGMRRALKCPSLKDFYEAIADMNAIRRPAAHQSYSGEELECFKRTADFISYGNEAIREAKTLFSDYETDKANESAAMTDAERVLASVERVAAKYAELKKKEEAFDYSDIERAALRILSDGGRADEFASGIDYIFFDEYQDVNPLQEAIITLIARDNLFMVGDVKQSIYRFRHSEPKLFLKRYREYGAGSGGTSVPLNMNFRSSQPILDFADRIFSKIMTPAFGGIDYDGTARFNRAGSDVTTEGFDPVKAVFFEPPEEPVIDLPEVYSMDAAPLALPDKDLEARFVADDILRSVSSDSIPVKGGGTARMRFSDIAVLARDSRTAERFIREFSARGIPFDTALSGTLFDKSDIDKLTAFLKLIDNPLQDFPLAAAMMSEGGGFDEKEVQEIASSGEGEYFHERVYSSKCEGALRMKLDAFNAAVARYRRMAPLTSVPELINAIAAERGFLTAMATDPKRLQAYNAYLKFISQRECADSVTDFLKWRAGIDAVPEAGGTGTGVAVMTMHRAKGLEFPSVYVVGAGRAFRAASSRKKAVADAEFGLGLKSYDEDERSAVKPLTRMAIEIKNAFEEKQEEARLTYVALTRARYRLRVTGYVGAKDKLPRFPEDAKCVRDWIYMAAADDGVLASEITLAEDLGTDRMAPKEKYAEYSGGAIDFYEYPHAEATGIANKYTVTALSASEAAELDDIQGAHTPSLGARDPEIGILYHKIMEKIDFAHRGEEDIRKILKELESEGEDVSGADIKALVKTLTLDVFDLAAGSGTLREQPFMYYAPARDILDVGCDDKVLVQGVMDLVIFGEKTVLVDYKISGASEKTLRERYSGQLRLYAEALGKATGKYPDKKLLVLLNRAEALEI